MWETINDTAGLLYRKELRYLTDNPDAEDPP